jgi:hypothetical protein
MNRLATDPNLQQCPDFTSDTFQASRAPLLNPAVDNAQAAIILQTIWLATNSALKIQWQEQVDAV